LKFRCVYNDPGRDNRAKCVRIVVLEALGLCRNNRQQIQVDTPNVKEHPNIWIQWEHLFKRAYLSLGLSRKVSQQHISSIPPCPTGALVTSANARLTTPMTATAVLPNPNNRIIARTSVTVDTFATPTQFVRFQPYFVQSQYH